MAWAFVFLSYFMPTAFLFIVLVLEWGQRDIRSRPSLVTIESQKPYSRH